METTRKTRPGVNRFISAAYSQYIITKNTENSYSSMAHIGRVLSILDDPAIFGNCCLLSSNCLNLY